MKFNKPATTFEEQIDLLESRGVIIPDKKAATHYLSHINYYRLGAYWLPFESDHHSHQFQAGVTFDHILNLYVFDRELRLLVLDAIERIEVSFRTQWAYHISHQYGPHGYLANNKALRKDERRLLNDIKDLRQHVRRSDEVFIQHYGKIYDEELPPAWVSCEVMSLGLLSRFYSNLRAYQVRRKIAETYQFDEGFLEGFMEHLSYVRNVCAHHSRLWNRELSIRPQRPRALEWNPPVTPRNDRIFYILLMLRYLLKTTNNGDSWCQKCNELIEPLAQDGKWRAAMGMPENWKEHPLWK